MADDKIATYDCTLSAGNKEDKENSHQGNEAAKLVNMIPVKKPLGESNVDSTQVQSFLDNVIEEAVGTQTCVKRETSETSKHLNSADHGEMPLGGESNVDSNQVQVIEEAPSNQSCVKQEASEIVAGTPIRVKQLNGEVSGKSRNIQGRFEKYSKKTQVFGVKDSPNASLQVTNEMLEEERKYEREEEKRLEAVKLEALEELSRTGKQERYDRLQNLLTKSQAYSTYILGRINKRREEEEARLKREEERKVKEQGKNKEKDEKQQKLKSENSREVRKKAGRVDDASSTEVSQGAKRKATDSKDGQQKVRQARKRQKADDTSMKIEYDEEVDVSLDASRKLNKGASVKSEDLPVDERQPKLLTGGRLRKYQLEGVEWLVGLYENGINGILADEMGLGKTLQAIALITSLIDTDVIGPFMVVAPLSTLPNWINEFKRFAPEVYTVLYHGPKDERARKRKKMMRVKRYSHGLRSLPVVITSYEVVIRDRAPLSAFGVEWKYLIIDEGHRLKNINCKLIKELKQYNTANRLLLTGTPLQNNLSELWSLLNFLLPDIFDDLASFQQWFDFSAISDSDFIADEQEAGVLQTLHSILTPFLLRRLKTDVDLSIPPKKEVLVYCPMSPEQLVYYKGTLDKTIFQMIEDKNHPIKEQEMSVTGRPARKTTKNVCYNAYGDVVEDGGTFDYDDFVRKIEDEDARRLQVHEFLHKKSQKKAIINIKLVNPLMMLRKCCNHPYLLEYPYDSETGQLIIDERLVNISGKMMMLDKMLIELRKRGHKTLVFSQMTMMMDIIGDFLNIRGLKYSRLDGTMKVEERQENIERFDTDPDTSFFLLSTRAGGLGLNLMMADTCIIYDSDWNPQVDLQAQDRCHRIGQTRPVVIYRLLTANTIDQRILERATSKRKLEKMVIHEKRFKGKLLTSSISPSELIELLGSSDVDSTVDIGSFMTDEQLEQLLDRSDLYRRMEKNKNSQEDSKTITEEKSAIIEQDVEQVPTSKLFTVVETTEGGEVAF